MPGPINIISHLLYKIWLNTFYIFVYLNISKYLEKNATKVLYTLIEYYIIILLIEYYNNTK